MIEQININSIQLSEDRRQLTIDWDGRHSSLFDSLWLFDNAPEHRNPKNNQRLVDVTDLPAEPIIDEVSANGDTVTVVWAVNSQSNRADATHADEIRSSTFTTAWLRTHSYSASISPEIAWRITDWTSPYWADAEEFCTSEIARKHWLAAVAERGIAFLRGVPAREGTVVGIASKIGFIRETNYGRIFDVRATPQPHNLAYSDLGLGLHTDNPYRDPVPGLQMLHCLRNSAGGGESIFADGFAIAQFLREQNPEAFDLLTATPVQLRISRQRYRADRCSAADSIGRGWPTGSSPLQQPVYCAAEVGCWPNARILPRLPRVCDSAALARIHS